MKVPASGLREHDKLDVAYFCLDDDCANELHPRLKVLSRAQVTLEKEPVHRLQYTFAGYPWRKSIVRGNCVETNSWTFTGMEVRKDSYQGLGLNRKEHIAIRFNRKRALHDRKREQMVAPLPHGMSGGGVYAWTDSALAASPVRLPLAGIANQFIPDRALLIATRLHVYINCICHEYPDLFITG
jgi:hypothetical protein